MSVKAKGIQTDKLLEAIAKADLDDQVKFFYDFKEVLDKKLIAREKELEDNKERISSIRERLNGN